MLDFFKKGHTWSREEIQAFLEMVCLKLDTPVPELRLVETAGSCFGFDLDAPEALYINISQSRARLPLELTIAHEARHCWQYHKKRLEVKMEYLGFYSHHVHLWDGKEFKYDWETCPWEIDAVEFENQIALQLGLPVCRYVNNGRIFTLESSSKIDKEKSHLGEYNNAI